MAEDYPVNPHRDSEVRELAARARVFFGISDDRHVNVFSCLERRAIWTVRGIERLNFQILPDVKMGGSDGLTSYDTGAVTIAISQSVYDDAFLGVGRARNTCAHEIGHAVMHDGVQMSRRAIGNKASGWIRPYESAEHQVKVFAPAFLINEAIAKTMSSAEEISIQFGVSLESATLYYQEQVERHNRDQIAEEMRRKAREFREAIAPASHQMRFMTEACPVCSHHTVFPVGNKFMCKTCDTVFDRFQDGDP